MFAAKVAPTRTNALANSANHLLQRRPALTASPSDRRPVSDVTGTLARRTPWDLSLIPVYSRSQTSGAQGASLGRSSAAANLQCKLVVGQANDPLEHEADRVAEQVVRMPAGAIATAPPQISRKCAACEAAEKASESDQTGADPTAKVQTVLRSSGKPLDPATRSYFEPRFGYDFGEVRVHSDSAASDSARGVNALAYTVGRHIVFGTGQFEPDTPAGSRLMAHELTHVVQQGGPGSGVLQRAPGDQDDKKDKPDKGDKAKPEDKPTEAFVGCSSEKQELIKDAITKAKDLAARAVVALERDFPMSYEITAMTAHFGSMGTDQKNTIIARYKEVQAKLEGKTYTCAAKGKTVKEGKTVVDLCGEGLCPGEKITIYPDFGKESCPAGPVMLHEALHNTGACLDVDTGKGYPPSSPEDNPYSYEHFAVDVASGGKPPPELKKRDAHAPR